MIDVASPAAGMCVVARWASRSRAFSACFRMERRPSVLRRKLNMMGGEEGCSSAPITKEHEEIKLREESKVEMFQVYIQLACSKV